MNIIKVDYETCSGCGNCYKACWIDVIRWDEVKERPVIAYPEDCVECNLCEINCSTGSLKVSPDFSKPWPNVYQ
jgi:NAD-dependent dihydropyrimidine dehydrogenase PreA subunit